MFQVETHLCFLLIDIDDYICLRTQFSCIWYGSLILFIFWLIFMIVPGGLCFCSLYRMQGLVCITCKCPTRSVVVEIEVSVPCCQGPCTDFCGCSADCCILGCVGVQILWGGTQGNVWL
uniref:Uncharacterized protein n=2 Tax=Rhizophora mucronata TaxID=61149 RepID=A0A2P2KMQ6_RHIMU